MRGRILEALEKAALLRGQPPTPDDPKTVTLARAALARSDARGWQLLEQPHRLDVQTIDSLCMRLAHGQPLLARLGGRLEPTEQAAAMYALAAERTMGLLGRAPAELEAALRHLLLLRDNLLGDCEKLLAEMLEHRDQWRHVFVLSDHASVDWDQVRAELEAPFAEEVQRALGALHEAFSREPTLASTVLELARYACSHGSRSDIALLDQLQALPPPHADFLDHWVCLRNFLLTQAGTWRKTLSKNDGFPTDGTGQAKAEQSRIKQRMGVVLTELQRDSEAGARLRAMLASVPTLPATRYDEPQWQTLRSVFEVLRRAVAELHVVFAEHNEVDFAELSIAAATVLDDKESTRGLLASESRRHLLIDEFQDTSRRQHQLIGRLLREWRPGDGRTCFLVGDPMQSIYIFRQAEVELFGRVQRRGLDCGGHTHPCGGLTLSENFRSHAGLVNPLNGYFERIFSPNGANTAPSGEVPFSRSHASRPALNGEESVQVHAFFCDTRDRAGKQDTRARAIARIVELVQAELPRIQAAAQGHLQPDHQPASYTVAILGRARNHLAPIAAALREREIPFRAIELETLSERQEILDLQSLLAALLHPSDRISWLSVLRAPWCGLTLADLHTLTGADDRSFRYTPVPELIAARRQLLSADGQARLSRLAAVLERAAAERFNRENAQSLATWLERTWASLGAPSYLQPDELENAEVFFTLLDSMPADGVDVLNGTLERALGRICAAPDASVSEKFGVQLMTIHKAKGLGFEVVIVPALERSSRGDDNRLIAVLERARHEPDAMEKTGAGREVDQVLVAPLGARGEQHRTYKWVQAQRRQREIGERKRLFYVACTRARERLHLLGTADVTATGELRGGSADSLLACAWPALENIFVAQRQAELARLTAAAPGHSTPIALVPHAPSPGLVDQLAAVAVTDTEPGELRLWRVPAGFAPSPRLTNVTVASTVPAGSSATTQQVQFERPQGSFQQRARGNAVHAMLEFVSQQWQRDGAAGDPATLVPALEQVAGTVLRRAGLAPARADALGAQLSKIVTAAATDAVGRWILSPHPGAQSEELWSGWSEGRLRSLRVDRTFRAGDLPLSSGSSYLWVIDYKTGSEPRGIALDAWLEAQQAQWRPQLEAYGAALRAFHGTQLPVRYGLFFPELLRLKSWPG